MFFHFLLWGKLRKFLGKGRLVFVVGKRFPCVFPYLVWDNYWDNFEGRRLQSIEFHYEVVGWDFIERMGFEYDEEIEYYLKLKRSFVKHFVEDLREKYFFYEFPLVEKVLRELCHFGDLSKDEKLYCANILFRNTMIFHENFISFQRLVNEVVRQEEPELLEDKFFIYKIRQNARVKIIGLKEHFFMKYPYKANETFLHRSLIPVAYGYLKNFVKKLKHEII